MCLLAQILLSQIVRTKSMSYGPTSLAGKLEVRLNPSEKVTLAGFVRTIQGPGLPLGAHCMKL